MQAIFCRNILDYLSFIGILIQRNHKKIKSSTLKILNLVQPSYTVSDIWS